MAPSNPIIIVGGGLAGLSAAHECYLRGSNVILLDKQGFLSGNSGKATSGINGSLTRPQINLNIKDSVDQFYQDTLTSAKEQANPDLIKVLTYQSSDAIHWLQEVFKLDLTVVSRLGGHSQPRTHRGNDNKFPGMAITYKLLEKLENLSVEEPDRVMIMKQCQVLDLILDQQEVQGVVYKDLKTKTKSELRGVVIMATGGYAADFTKNSLLRKYRPDIFNLPSTNGEHATGDGQKIMMKNHATGIDLEKVQVHPTGLIDYDSKDVISGAKQPRFLFLGAEALRGEGGIMVNGKGKRFVNELGTRDYVSGEMEKVDAKGDGPIRLILTEKMAAKLTFHVKHYQQRNLMRKVTGEDLVKDMGIDASVLAKELEEYNSHDESNPDKFGKKYYPNGPAEFDLRAPYYVSFVTRVLHFTMGGIKINDKAEVVSESNVFKGLYACGEVAGGVHGHNRLGGSSLLACVVFGRLAADQASSLMLKQLSKISTDVPKDTVATSRLKQIQLHIDPDQNKVSVSWGNGTPEGQPEGEKSAPTPPSKESSNEAQNKPQDAKPSKPGPKALKEFTVEEVASHNKPEDCWCIIKNLVLNLSPFLSSHPGGAESILNFAGKDATESFEMLHDDNVVSRYASECVVGVIKGEKPGLPY